MHPRAWGCRKINQSAADRSIIQLTPLPQESGKLIKKAENQPPKKRQIISVKSRSG